MPPIRYLVVVLIFLHLPQLPNARAQDRLRVALDVVNGYRRAAGLASVTLDARMNRACQEHTRYMVMNAGHPSLRGLKLHEQDPHLPGTSSEGAWCGKNADLFPRVGSPAAAVHGWMNSLYHRTPLLRPGLRRIGIAEAPYPKGGVAAALMLDPVADRADDSAWPIRYPAANQTGVPLAFLKEEPNPISGRGRGGYPITLHFPAGAELRDVTAKLYGPAGNELPIHLSHPKKPASSFSQGDTVCLIPKAPLRPATHYLVHIELDWQGTRRDYSWTFQTVNLSRLDAQDAAALRQLEELPARVVGKVIQAWQIQDDHAVMLKLQWGAQEHSLIVDMDHAIWEKVAPGKPPAAFNGRMVEVVSIVEGNGQSLSLPILEPWQLEFLPQGELPIVDAADSAALRARIGQRIKVRGLLTYGGGGSQGKQIFLQLNDRVLTAFVPPAVWQAVAGSRAPTLLQGHTLEIEALLEKGNSDGELHMIVHEDAQLRILPLGDLPIVDATNLPALQKHAGRRIKVRGLIMAGGQVNNSSDLFLQLKSPDAAWKLSVFVEAPIWRDIAAGKRPEELLGRTVEIEAAPALHGQSVHFSILDPQQLRIGSTDAIKRVQATETAALISAQDQLILVLGRVIGGAHFENSKGAYLTLATAKGSEWSVFLDIDAATWSRFARAAPPSSFEGRLIQARAVPQPDKGDLRLKVRDAQGLQVIGP